MQDSNHESGFGDGSDEPVNIIFSCLTYLISIIITQKTNVFFSDNLKCMYLGAIPGTSPWPIGQSNPLKGPPFPLHCLFKCIIFLKANRLLVPLGVDFSPF